MNQYLSMNNQILKQQQEKSIIGFARGAIFKEGQELKLGGMTSTFK